MLRQYAPVPGTARRSPGCTSAGRNSSFTMTSPDSQCFPTTRASNGSATLVRLDGQPRLAQVLLLALALDDLVDPLRQVTGGRRVVLGRVRDAETTAQVQLGQFHPASVPDPRLQLEHPAGGHLE